MDIISNDILKESLSKTGLVAVLASEEVCSPKQVSMIM